jgi:hypothetical protein
MERSGDRHRPRHEALVGDLGTTLALGVDDCRFEID